MSCSINTAVLWASASLLWTTAGTGPALANSVDHSFSDAAAQTDAGEPRQLPRYNSHFAELFAEWQSIEYAAGPNPASIRVSDAADIDGAVFDAAIRQAKRRIDVASRSARALKGTSGSARLPSYLPVASRALTSGFGNRRHPILGGTRFHAGIDLSASAGSPVVAPSDGIVSAAGWNGGYGLFVAIQHPGGLQTRYGHLSRVNVHAGQAVKKGELIGLVGSTGRSTGPHLHYETRVNGAPVNPLGQAK